MATILLLEYHWYLYLCCARQIHLREKMVYGFHLNGGNLVDSMENLVDFLMALEISIGKTGRLFPA